MENDGKLRLQRFSDDQFLLFHGRHLDTSPCEGAGPWTIRRGATTLLQESTAKGEGFGPRILNRFGEVASASRSHQMCICAMFRLICVLCFLLNMKR